VLTSAPILVTVVPTDPSWARDQVDRARALIASGVSEDVRQGARMLQYLGTEAAATALADDYDAVAAVDASAARTGLVLSPYRATAIATMDARIDRGLPLHRTFISTVAWLRVLEEMSGQTDATRRGERTKTLEAEYDTRWRDAVAQRPPSAATLAAELQRLQSGPNGGIADDLAAHPTEAVAAFAALPASDQETLLRGDVTWRDLNRPWIDAALEQIYAGWRGSATQGASAGAGDLILTRLYARNPDVGRALILDEIRTGAHQVRYDALAMLPDVQLPELDGPLQARYTSPPSSDLLNDRATTAWLVARYGSDSLGPWVGRTLAAPLPSCMVEAGLLAYLLKHDAPAAMARLDPARPRTTADGCVTPPFEQLAPRYWDASVEALVIRQLMSPTIDDVRTAAQVLGRYGSVAARQPLLDRLTSWSNEWRGRAADLIPAGPRTYPSPEQIENALTNALFDNPRFALTRDDAMRIDALCVTDACRINVGARSRRLP
jgi:hypothetical protein